MVNMANKEQLKRIAISCSRYNFVGDTGLKSEANILGDTVRSCENCEHFTKDHKCELNLIDKILSNLAEVDYEGHYE